MLHVAIRAGATLVKFTRPYSKVTAYLRELSAHTRDPLWALVIALHSPRGTSLTEALTASRVPLDEFARWRPCVYASDIDEATKNAESHPSWLVLYLAGFKVQSPANASGTLMDMSFAHMATAPPSVQGPLLVLVMMHLARFDLVPPMKRVIDAFLSIPFTQYQDGHYNHLLSAMTSIQVPSSQTGRNAVRVLASMEARQLTLRGSTCSALLHDRHAALQLTSYLRRRQTRLGILPTASQLEEYLRIYAADGAIHDAQRYADAIRELRRGPKSDQEASAIANRANRRNTFLVRSQPDSASAFHFLLGLAAKSGRDRPFFPRKRPSIHPRGLLGKRFVDLYDWSSALAVSANDKNINAKHLVKLFRYSRPRAAEFRLTAAAYTILIRGLLSRQAWELAYIHWTKLARSGLPIDEPALAVGIEATVLSGRPAEAFLLLEMHAAPLSSFFRLHRRVKVTTRLINSFMVCLSRILRPDLVFRLWDAMEDLYHLHPSPETLRIVLEAAQLPHTLDDSFSGQLALLALKNPFRGQPSPLTTREALLESLTTQAAAPYRSGIWQGRPATETASRIFIQAVVGSPDRLHLANLELPAQAVRSYPESDGAAPTLLRPPHHSQWTLPPDILTPHGRARFPTLLGLREQDFCAHVVLLGMTRRAPDIMRTFVWMRALGVRPRERTLGVGMAFWSEVSVQPPLIAAMAGKGRDQYLKFVEWLRDWVGEDLPDERSVGRWRGKIALVRAQRRDSAGTGRVGDEEQIWKM
ncbi:hypothetical protein FB45DRAFT_948181 [Roridomyces roridus]|uniref:Uncharacterized protein n=1 Tax=Roridomyces roridus TaxID=1738132 RepID=A0AAD7F7P7_9AGAR|nr:hypothetical protein FB45DRAFT_948181 [Roridomyces roridus]